MANKSIIFTEENFYEWLCSTGYLLPTNERELSRFERLYPTGSVVVNENAINPFEIILEKKEVDEISINKVSFKIGDEHELRLAARKYDSLPPEILEKIKQNQQNINDSTGNQSQNTD